MQRFRLRAAVTASTDSAPRVDREAGVIRGVAVMTSGEARGHGMLIDGATLNSTADLINAREAGMKSRFTHPGMCDDGMGKKLGNVKNARVVGDQVVADLHFSGSASRTPEGDLAGYVFDLAEEAPADFGLSVVITGKQAWKLADGAEVQTRERPANATTDKPFLRPSGLSAVDVVDDPAANPSGLLAAAFSSTSNADAAEVFAALDALRESRGLTLSQSHAFLSRYFDARGFTPDPKGTPMIVTPERLADLCEKHPSHSTAIVKQFAAGKPEAEILAAIQAADHAALAARVDELTAALAAKDVAHAAALKAEADKLAELQAKHTKLAALGGHAPADPGHAAAGAGGGDTLKAEWEAMSASKRLGYFDSEECYREARRLEAIDLAAKGSAV